MTYHNEPPPPATYYVPVTIDTSWRGKGAIDWMHCEPDEEAALGRALDFWEERDEDLLICKIEVTFVPVKELLGKESQAELAELANQPPPPPEQRELFA